MTIHLTADTITDDQILELRRVLWGQCSRADWTTIGDALIPDDAFVEPGTQRAARARCAEIYNEGYRAPSRD
jgi:hypothetical protein